LAINTKLHGTFCSQMKAWRRAKELTQADLAKRMHVSQPNIAALESGRFTPSIDIIDAVATAIGISAEHLLFLEPSEIFS